MIASLSRSWPPVVNNVLRAESKLEASVKIADKNANYCCSIVIVMPARVSEDAEHPLDAPDVCAGAKVNQDLGERGPRGPPLQV